MAWQDHIACPSRTTATIILRLHENLNERELFSMWWDHITSAHVITISPKNIVLIYLPTWNKVIAIFGTDSDWDIFYYLYCFPFDFTNLFPYGVKYPLQKLMLMFDLNWTGIYKGAKDPARRTHTHYRIYTQFEYIHHTHQIIINHSLIGLYFNELEPVQEKKLRYATIQQRTDSWMRCTSKIFIENRFLFIFLFVWLAYFDLYLLCTY